VTKQDEFHFSRPSQEVAASLLIVFGYTVTAEMYPPSRAFMIPDLRLAAPEAVNTFFLDLARMTESVGRRRQKPLSTIALETKDLNGIIGRQKRSTLFHQENEDENWSRKFIMLSPNRTVSVRLDNTVGDR
jgi:hypothetical protein